MEKHPSAPLSRLGGGEYAEGFVLLCSCAATEEPNSWSNSFISSFPLMVGGLTAGWMQGSGAPSLLVV